MIDFKELKKQLKKEMSSLKKVKIALLSDVDCQFFVQALKGSGVLHHLDFDIFYPGYDQVDLQVFDKNSEFYDFNPDFVLLFNASEKAWVQYCSYEPDQNLCLAEEYMQRYRRIIDQISSTVKTKIIIANFPVKNFNIFGNFSNCLPQSFEYQIRKLNFELMNFANEKNIYICDTALLYSRYGESFAHDTRLYITADTVFSLDFLAVMAENTTSIVLAALGFFKKCLIIDLDNTIWGGVVGDDGLDHIQIGDLGVGKAFTNMQRWVKQLKKRGIIIAVCSKNEDVNAKEPFLKHPDMVLSLDDIAIFKANWDNKVDNIQIIQEQLNINFDSMVFVDDNPVEREMVKKHLPAVTVPDLPADPADYVLFLSSLNLFETVSYTDSDTKRTALYQSEIKRVEQQKTFVDVNAFLKDLSMVCTIDQPTDFNIPRIAQLTQRSNQFNLRTKRYMTQDIERMAQSNDYIIRAFSYKDKYGDTGVISVIIIKKTNASFFIDTWIMSCRVLKRNIEKFVLNYIVTLAQAEKVDVVIGEYLPTLKNDLVKNHYSDLGFNECNGQWKLDVKSFTPFEHEISQE